MSSTMATATTEATAVIAISVSLKCPCEFQGTNGASHHYLHEPAEQSSRRHVQLRNGWISSLPRAPLRTTRTPGHSRERPPHSLPHPAHSRKCGPLDGHARAAIRAHLWSLRVRVRTVLLLRRRKDPRISSRQRRPRATPLRDGRDQRLTPRPGGSREVIGWPTARGQWGARCKRATF